MDLLGTPFSSPSLQHVWSEDTCFAALPSLTTWGTPALASVATHWYLRGDFSWGWLLISYMPALGAALPSPQEEVLDWGPAAQLTG